MGERLFGLTRTQLERFVRMLDRDELSPREDLLNQHYPQTDRIEHCVGVVNSPGITARSGTTAGTGTVTVKKFTTGTAANHAETRSISVFNLGAAITTDSYVVCHRHPETGGASTMGPWLVEVPQGGSNSSSTPPTGPSTTTLPCYAVRNNADQNVTGGGAATTVEFGTQIHTYGDITYDGANHEVETATAGVYRNLITVPVSTSDGADAGSIWVEQNGTKIVGTHQYTFGQLAYEQKTFVFDVVTAAADALRVRLQPQTSATTIINGSSDFFARWQISKIRDA